MVSSEQFYSSTTLWIICHRIAKHREGDLNESDLVQFYEETSARQDQDENCLPTKALMVLMKAHEALEKHRNVTKKRADFLRFFLDELAETMSLPAVKSAIASDRKYLAIVENVQVEVYQCINCAFGESKSLRKYDDHASQCKWRADWNLAKTILPLLLPSHCLWIFKFVLEVEPTLEAQLLDFCKQPPVMELREVTDPDGIALEYAEEYQTDEDPRNILSIQSRQYLCDVSEDRKDQLSLSAKCLYLSSLAQHRNNINTPNQDMMRMIRCCLAIANPYLDSQLQSSVWYMYARNLANEYIMLPSHELVDQQDFCEAHLDIATITYQVRTRIKRFSARSDVEEEKRRKARAKMDGMLLKCRVHFELARKHNDSQLKSLGCPLISWLRLLKNWVKLRKRYKIHRSKQINFEPLEIHYKLHSYALKKVNEWKNMNKFQLKSSLHSSLSTLHTLSAIYSCLPVMELRPKLPGQTCLWKSQLLHYSNAPPTVNKNSLATDVLATVDNLVDAVSQQLQIQSTCMYAFETIMAKFPHYKACYRMAKLAFVKGDYKACTAAAKKRGNTTVPPINSSTSLFENVVEISRADIERSGSYAYHIHKIFNLAIISTYKCNDLGRLVLLLSSLATIRNEEQAPDKMGREDIRGLQTKCSNAITKIAPLPKMSTDKLLHNCSLLQDLLRKLKKETMSTNRQQHAEQAARMPQEQEHPTQQLQPAPVEKRNTSPLPLPHATNKIAVITIPETPPRPSTITDHAATATTSASSTSQEHSDLRNVIKQHLLLHRSRKQQHEPAKKAVKRALDGCQTSPDKQQHNGNQSAGGGAPQPRR
uniref:Uncharacterized protein n=1 Tax=Ditylenchus dipsaci TaxID=166011 RepID=A0A915EB69_9BILA